MSGPVTGRDPGYLQIAKELSARIRSGEYAFGDRLPSERALAEQLGVSRVTTRQAIQVLYHQGLVTRRQGSGTYVNHLSHARSASMPMSFGDQMRLQGVEPAIRVLAVEVVPAPAAVAETLAVRLASPVIRVEQLFLGNGSPLGWNEIFLPTAPFPGLETLDLNQDLAPLLEGFGVRVARSETTLSPKAASAEEARLLGVSPGEPLMSITWVEMDHRGWAFNCGTTVYRDTAASFRVIATDEHRP